MFAPRFAPFSPLILRYVLPFLCPPPSPPYVPPPHCSAHRDIATALASGVGCVSPDSVFYFDDAGPPCAAKKNSAAGEGGNKLACSREEEGGGVGGVKGEKNEEGETKGDGGKAEDNVLYTLPQGSGIIGVRYVAEETERERERV